MIEPVGLVLNDVGECPEVTVTGPAGEVVYHSTEPNATLSIDAGVRMVVSFLADRSGPYRLQIAARRQVSEQLPYRLWVRRTWAAISTAAAHPSRTRWRSSLRLATCEVRRPRSGTWR